MRRGVAIAGALLLLSVSAAAQDAVLDAVLDAALEWDGASTCVSCHEVEEDEDMSLPVPEWRGSVHAVHLVSCDACHGGDPRLEDPDESMSEAAGFLDLPAWTEVSSHCGVCHEDVAVAYDAGRFGRALREGVRVATCATCHMREGHRIVAAVPEEIDITKACPGCPSVRDVQGCIAILSDVREREIALASGIDAVEAKGIELTDLRAGLASVHATFASSVHEFDDDGMDAARALALTQYDGLGEQVASLDVEADKRRRLGFGLLSALALLFLALLGSARSLGS